jgi:putative transposase
MPKDSIPFRGFDERGDVRIYDHGVLPHWRQTGCTYFVTFRLCDSIPASVLEEVEYERIAWLKGRNIDPRSLDWQHRLAALPDSERRQYEKLIATLLNRELDKCHGSCVFRDPVIREIVALALDFFHHVRVLTGDYVVMPNHVHALLTPCRGYELEDILHSVKGYTANQINRQRKTSGSFWQRETYDHIVREFEQLHGFRKYIADDPVKGKSGVNEYSYSCAEYRPIVGT